MNFDPTKIDGFEWDDGNLLKSETKHGVSKSDAEQVFHNGPLVAEDAKHSQNEPRYCAVGQTDTGHPLFVAFTVRGTKIRVISARTMSRKERKTYGYPK